MLGRTGSKRCDPIFNAKNSRTARLGAGRSPGIPGGKHVLCVGWSKLGLCQSATADIRHRVIPIKVYGSSTKISDFQLNTRSPDHAGNVPPRVSWVADSIEKTNKNRAVTASILCLYNLVLF